MVLSFFAAVDAAASAEVLTRAAEHHDWKTFALSTAALSIINWGTIAALRRALRRRAFFRTGNGARALAALTTLAEALALALAGGVPLENAITQALIATAVAAGGYSLKPRRKRPPTPAVVVPPTPEAPA